VIERGWRPATGGGGGGEPCAAGETTLCLGPEGRFRVEAVWRTPPPNGAEGAARTLPLTADTGAFWFFDAANVELIVKVLGACPVNGRVWVFAAGLTDVEVELTVTDTADGTARIFRSRARIFRCSARIFRCSARIFPFGARIFRSRARPCAGGSARNHAGLPPAGRWEPEPAGDGAIG
jgi:hypothetical protein